MILRVIVVAVVIAMSQQSRSVSYNEVLALPASPADHRMAYGSDPLQFGELRLPKGQGPHPVVVLVHGGCWQSAYDIAHSRPMAASLADAGFAVWSLEYRRIGDEGGGWPGTFLDVAAGTDHLRTIARTHSLDLTQVVAMGHSAGGQLVLWLATRGNAASDDPLASPSALPLAGVVALAPIADMATYGAEKGGCNSAVTPLMGGTPAEVAPRYASVDPLKRLPVRVPVRLVHGTSDTTVRIEQSERFAEAARAAGSPDVQVVRLMGAAHFDVIAPTTQYWPTIVDVTRRLVR